MFKRDWRYTYEMPGEYRRAMWRLMGITPSLIQEGILLDTHRSVLVGGGERASKSFITGIKGSEWAADMEPGEELWIVGPDYDQARPEFNYMRDNLQNMGLLTSRSFVSTPLAGIWTMRTELGGTIITKSSNDPRKLASRPPMAVLMTEAAQHPYEVFLRLQGRLAQKRAPMFLSGTFEGSLGWYPELWWRWQGDNAEGGISYSLPTWSNEFLFPGGRENEEIKHLEAVYPPDLFMERFGGVPCPPARIVFREFDARVHVSNEVVYRPGVAVQLWIDPGYNHPYAVMAVHVTDRCVDNFDEIWKTGVTGKDIITECMQRPWWKDVKVLVMDKAGRQHHSAESQKETWQSRTGLPIVMNSVGIVEGIMAHHLLLAKNPETGIPRLRHSPVCKGAIWEYGHYLNNKDSEGSAATELPLDRNNECMKAIAYGAVANFGFADTAHQRQVIEVRF